jgi:hypothetical protein
MASVAVSALKVPYALCLTGVQKLLNVLPFSGTRASRNARTYLYKTSEQAQTEFAPSPSLFGAFQVGDLVQDALFGLAANVLTLRILTPKYLGNVTSSIAKTSKEAVRTVVPRAARRLMVERLRNAFAVIGFVNQVDAPSQFSPDGPYPLAETIAKGYDKGDYQALWAIEGTGERYADAFLAAGNPFTGILRTGAGADLPDKSLLMMHAGIGIAFAKEAMRSITPYSSGAEIRDALQRFIDRSLENSRPGYEGATLESLGLVTRTWYGQMVQLATDQLRQIDPVYAEYFWRGAGRAMFFTPLNMMPGFSPFDSAEQEPPDEVARLNARAGVSWAFNLVNLRQPEISANLMGRKSAEIFANDGFMNGLLSTFVMATDMIPGDPWVARFCAYQPNVNDSAAVSAWSTHIGADLAARIDLYRKTLKEHNKLGEIFRYHELPKTVAEWNSAARV